MRAGLLACWCRGRLPVWSRHGFINVDAIPAAQAAAAAAAAGVGGVGDGGLECGRCAAVWGRVQVWQVQDLRGHTRLKYQNIFLTDVRNVIARSAFDSGLRVRGCRDWRVVVAVGIGAWRAHALLILPTPGLYLCIQTRV